MNNKEIMIKVEGLKKEYRLGQFGYGTLTADMQSWWAKLRGKEDPNSLLFSSNNTKKDRFLALDDVNFEIYKGEVVGIIGGNGAGKSTLLKLISRITSPTQGAIYLNGQVSSMLEVGTGFNPEMTGRENIYMNGTILGMKRTEIDAKMQDIVNFSECEQFIDTPVKRYSSGMYVKLAFAVAAHLDSEILIMDEVLAVGDMKFQKKCIQKMRELASHDGKTVLYVSHNMSTVRDLCSRGIVLKKGKMDFDGDVDAAIKIYGDNEAQNATHYLFEEYSTKVSNGSATLDELIFTDRAKLSYRPSESISFTLIWTPNVSDCEFFFRIMVLDINKKAIGMTNCSLGKDFTPSSKQSLDIEFEVNELSEGEYFLNFELSKIDSLGEPITCFWSDVIAGVTITDEVTEDLRWDKKNWGDIRFRKLKIIQENS